MLVEADGLVEEGAAVVDDGVDAAELLEDLDRAGDEEAAARVEGVGADDVFPAAGVEFGFDAHRLDNVGVQLEDVRLGGVVGLEAAQDVEGLVLAVVRREPARRFGQDPEQEEHGRQEDPLEDAGDAPGKGGVVGGEGKVDPVDEGGGEVEGRELHADVCKELSG